MPPNATHCHPLLGVINKYLEKGGRWTPFSLIFTGFQDKSPKRRSGYISWTISTRILKQDQEISTCSCSGQSLPGRSYVLVRCSHTVGKLIPHSCSCNSLIFLWNALVPFALYHTPSHLKSFLEPAVPLMRLFLMINMMPFKEVCGERKIILLPS